MLAAADPSQVPGLSRFFKTGPGQYGEGDKFLGIKVPVTRSIVKAHWKGLAASGDPFPELERCIGSEYHEVRLAAVGWLLREAGQRNQEALEAFLLPRYRHMPRTMLRYAIEKFPEPLRRLYLN